MSLTNTDKQDLRHAVLYACARRPLVGQTAGQVSVALKRLLPFEFTPVDAQEALEFQAGLGNLTVQPDPYGSEKTYQVTPAGTLAYERDHNKTA